MSNMRFSRLTAVNRILMFAGEQPVNSLSDDGINDTALAEAALDQCTAEIQKEGLTVNTEIHTYAPDVEGNIYLPTGTLRVDAVKFNRNVTQRGYQPTRLYDLDNNTYTFTDEIEINLVVGIAFEDLPMDIQFAIVDKAARMYQMITVGDTNMDQILAEQELRSRMGMMRANEEQGDFNLFKNMNNNAYWAVTRLRKPSAKYKGLIDNGY